MKKIFFNFINFIIIRNFLYRAYLRIPKKIDFEGTPNFNPLINIGRQDISTFVNFTHISNIAKSLNLLVDGYISQSSFLINLGILNIFEEKKYSEEQKIIELNRLKNLLLPNTMGEIFKVLVLKKNLDNQLLSTKKLNHLHKL